MQSINANFAGTTQNHSFSPPLLLSPFAAGLNSKVKTTGLTDLPRAKPGFIEPMYATSVHELPEGSQWLYEIKLDGYRCLAGKESSGVALWSRRGNLFTNQFVSIARACARLAPGTLVDGEIVALDNDGRISFNLLQHCRSKARALQYYAFDLLIYRRRSLLKVPLQNRRELLAEALGRVREPIRLSESFHAKAADVLAAAKELAVEGIVAKRTDSFYESGKRSGAWAKYKINRTQEFVIAGYTPGTPFDALIVGCYQGGKLNYVAKVRNGFVPRVRLDTFQKLKGLEIKTCPFANLPEKKRTPWALTREEMKNCRWLEPELLAQVEFTEWTGDGHLREAKFIGLRDDKDPRTVTGEKF
jgi:DNA ligase D-like protein (predicted ligase)